MKQISLIVAALAVSVSASADTYFFSPEGAGEKDGSSWENAAEGTDLGATLTSLGEGDQVYLMGGNYKPDINMGYWNIPSPGVKVMGGYPTTMTGTDTTLPLPITNYTIWDADLDGDGKGDNGGVPFVRIGTAENVMNGETEPDVDVANSAVTVLQGIIIKNCTGTKQYKGAAMLAARANMELDHVQFIDNAMTENKGGVVVLRGCKFYAHDCVWKGNKSNGASMALQMRQYDGNSAAANTHLGGYHILERCDFTNNVVRDDVTLDPSKNVASYGGALAIADGGGTLIMVNCTITGSHISVAGAGIRVGGNVDFYNINNTWYDCTTNYTGRAQGMIISVGTGAKLYTANSIVVNTTDGITDKAFAIVQIQSDQCDLVSGGYNLWGSFGNFTNKTLIETDNQNENNVIATAFGSNEAKYEDVFNVREPLETFRTVPTESLAALATEWGLPECIDLTLDITGKKRPATTVPGNYDKNAGSTSGTNVITIEADQTTRAYDLNGRPVNFDNAPRGIYILKQGNTVKKVVK